MIRDGDPDRNYGPLSALVLCLGLWWVLLAGVLDGRTAAMIVSGVAFTMAAMAALGGMLEVARVEA
jgi:hypothetical protein